MTRWLRPWWIVAVVGLVYMAVVVTSAGGDPLALATLGTRFSEGDPGGTEGYDGQFSYYIARDPLNGWQHCDVPAYRYQRILYPLLGRLSGLWPGAPPTLRPGLGQRRRPCCRDLVHRGAAAPLQNEPLVRHHLRPVRRPAHVRPAAGGRAAGPRPGPGSHPGRRTRSLALERSPLCPGCSGQGDDPGLCGRLSALSVGPAPVAPLRRVGARRGRALPPLASGPLGLAGQPGTWLRVEREPPAGRSSPSAACGRWEPSTCACWACWPW